MKVRTPNGMWRDDVDNVIHEAETAEAEKKTEQKEFEGNSGKSEEADKNEEAAEGDVAEPLISIVRRATTEEVERAKMLEQTEYEGNSGRAEEADKNEEAVEGDVAVNLTCPVRKQIPKKKISLVGRLSPEEAAASDMVVEAEMLEPKNTEKTPEMSEANIEKTLTEEFTAKQQSSPAIKPEMAGISMTKPNELSMTRCSVKNRNAEPQFFTGDVTSAVYKGKLYKLFEGTLSILERRIYSEEEYDAYGIVRTYNTSVRFYVSLEVKGCIYNTELSIKELEKGDFLAEISFGVSSLKRGSKQKELYIMLMQKLMSATDDYQTRKIFSTPGWKCDDENSGRGWYYVTPAGVIGRPELQCRCEAGKVFGVNTMYAGKSVIADFLSMRNILPRNLVVAIVLQYYLIMSLLKSLLRSAGMNPQFIVAIRGETNSKKTTIAHLFCKLYDRWNHVDIDFTATPVALEEAMGDNADAVTIFDDLTPPNTSDGAREQKKKMEILVRSYGGNLAKKRSRAYVIANSGANEYTPVLSQALVTGETLPVTLTSSLSRIVKVELERSDCDLQWLTWHQQHLEILPAFAWDFITFVTDNQHSILQNWRTVFDTERRMNSLKLGTPRFVESYAMFKAAVETFKAYLNASGCMSEAEIDTLAMADINAIGQLIKENDEELIDRPDEVLIAECIINEMEVQDKSEANRRPEEEILDQEELVMVYPSYLRKILTDFYRCNGRPMPFSTTNELSKFLDRKGLILTSSDSTQVRFALKKRDAYGKYRRYYCFYKDELERLKAI